MKARGDRRRAERKWRASKLDSDFEQFRTRRNCALHAMDVSRRVYPRNILMITARTGKALSGQYMLFQLAGKALPPHEDARVLANKLGKYFVHKITAIRSEIDADDNSSQQRCSVILSNKSFTL